MALTQLRGLLYIALLVVPGCCIVIFAMLPLVPLLIIPQTRSLYRTLTSSLVATWLVLATILVDWLARMNIKITGDPFNAKDKHVLFICNHRTRIDWTFFWMYCFRNQRLHSMKIVAKDFVRFVPPLGYTSTRFLDRDAEDEFIEM